MNKTSILNKTVLFLALLFHVSGLIGILCTPYKDWFIKATPLNLILMALLLIATHPQKNKKFFLFFLIAVVTGFAAEAIGINTALLFGNYSYGKVLGFQLLNVPLIIGLNWFIIIYCAGMFTQAYENYMLRRLDERGLALNKKLKLASFIVDAVFLTVLFDWIAEPVAIKLNYWQWQTGLVPLYNYISWMLVSAFLLVVFRKFNNQKRNIFAIHLFMIQVLFFLILRTFL